MAKKDKLKPCPWCGNKGVEVIRSGYWYYVWCSRYDCNRVMEDTYPTKEAAIRHWNALPRPNYDAFQQQLDDIGVREG